MNTQILSDSPEEIAAFCARVRDVLATIGADASPQEWRDALRVSGLLTGFWPRAAGGEEWSGLKRKIYDQILAEEDAPFIEPEGLAVVATALMVHGTAAQRSYWLPRLVSGEERFALSRGGPGRGKALQYTLVGTSGSDDEGAYVTLDGVLSWPLGSKDATVMSCLALIDGATQQVFVPLQHPNVRCETEQLLDGSERIARVFITQLRLGADRLLGPPGSGLDLAMQGNALDAMFGASFGRAISDLCALNKAIGHHAPGIGALSNTGAIRRAAALLQSELMALAAMRVRLTDLYFMDGEIRMEATLLLMRIDSLRMRLKALTRRSYGLWGMLMEHRSVLRPKLYVDGAAPIPSAEGAPELAKAGHGALMAELTSDSAAATRGAARRAEAAIFEQLIAGGRRSTFPDRPGIGTILERLRQSLSQGIEPEGPWLWDMLGEIGLLQALMPPEAGGTDGSPEALILIARELGRQQIALPVIDSLLIGGRVLWLSGEAEDLLEDVIAGRRILSLANPEPFLSFDTPGLQIGPDDLLSGRRFIVAYGDVADFILVVSGEAVHLLSRDLPNVELTSYHLPGGMTASDLGFRAAPSAPLASVETLRDAAVEANLALAAQSLGIMEAVFEMICTAYRNGKTLQSGWPPDTEQQVINMANLLVQTEGALLQLAIHLDQTKSERALRVTACRAQSGAAAREMVSATLRLIGQDALTQSSEFARPLAQLLAQEVRLGDTDYHADVLAEQIRATGRDIHPSALHPKELDTARGR